MKNCDIVKDILPLYVDGVVSEETKELVEEHLRVCENCKKELEDLTQMLPKLKVDVEEEVEVFKKVKSQINRKKYIAASISIALTLMVVVIGYMIYENVGVVNEYFTPMDEVFVIGSQDQWILLEENLNFDSIFYQKKVTNHIVFETVVELRILDMNDEVIIDSLVIESGRRADLSVLKSNQEYQIYVKTKGESARILHFTNDKNEENLRKIK